MITLRNAALMLCTLLAVAAYAGGRSARAEEPAPAPAAHDACARASFHVVVDVGHTVAVPGAMSARGVPEYTFNLALATKIKDALTAAGFSETTLLITATAPWRGLFERAARANAMHADLFIAIHHDSVPDNLMKTWQFDGQNEGYNDDYPGYALFISNDNADRAGSLQFGSLLGKELEARGLTYTPHYTLPIMGHRRRELVDAKSGVYRYDQLIVLRATRMPAVLLEAGSIVNRDEELKLATPERQTLAGAAVAAAVEEFCAARAPIIEAKISGKTSAKASASKAAARPPATITRVGLKQAAH